MQNIAEVLRKIAKYSLADRAGFEALVKNSLAKGQTDEMKKQQKRIPQITHRLEQIEKVMDKLYEDNAPGAIEPDRYEQLSQKYAEEYYPLKKILVLRPFRLSRPSRTSSIFCKWREKISTLKPLTVWIFTVVISLPETENRIRTGFIP